MTQKETTKIVKESIYTLNNLIKLDNLLSTVKKFSSEKNIPESILLKSILNKYGEDWHSNLVYNLSKTPGEEYKVAAYYCIIASFAVDDFMTYLDIDIEDEEDADTVKYGLRMNIRLIVSNLSKAFNSLTNLFTNTETIKLIEMLEKKYSKDTIRDYVELIEEQGRIKFEVKNSLQELQINPEDISKLHERIKKYLIVVDLGADDKVLYAEFCKKVSASVKYDLQDYIYEISRLEMSELVEKCDEDCDELVERIKNKLDIEEETLSLIPEYKRVYTKIVDKEERDIKYADIEVIPINILQETLVLGKVTDKLRNAIRNPMSKEEGLGETDIWR